MDEWALTGRPWNLHAGREGRRLKAKQESSAGVCARSRRPLCDCAHLKHSRAEIAASSLYLCFSMCTLQGGDETVCVSPQARSSDVLFFLPDKQSVLHVPRVLSVLSAERAVYLFMCLYEYDRLPCVPPAGSLCQRRLHCVIKQLHQSDWDRSFKDGRSGWKWTKLNFSLSRCSWSSFFFNNLFIEILRNKTLKQYNTYKKKK